MKPEQHSGWCHLWRREARLCLEPWAQEETYTELKDLGTLQAEPGQGHPFHRTLVGLFTAFPLVSPAYSSPSQRPALQTSDSLLEGSSQGAHKKCWVMSPPWLDCGGSCRQSPGSPHVMPLQYPTRCGKGLLYHLPPKAVCWKTHPSPPL